MFRKVYKSANDDIIPNSRLLEKILKADKKTETTSFSSFARYGSMAAAFLILVGTLSIYPKLKDNFDINQTTEIKISTGEDASDTKSQAEIVIKDNETDTPKPEQASTDTNGLENELSKTAEKTKENKDLQKTETETSLRIVSSPSPTASASVGADSETDNEYMSVAQNIPETSENNVKEESDAEEVQTVSVEDDIAPAAYMMRTSQEAEVQTAEAQNLSEEPAAFDGETDKKASARISSGGGGGAPKMTLEKAEEIADRAFLEDFGDEFLSSSDISVEFDEVYIITRYNENANYTVTVTTDGDLKKLY